MRKVKPKVKKENSERWLLTYSDLITLLMAFFVIMYAMSNVSQAKFSSMASQLAIAFNSGSGILPGGTGVLSSPYEVENGALERAAQAVDAAAADQNLALDVNVSLGSDGILIRMTDVRMFAAGSAELTPVAKTFLDQVATQVKTLGNHLRIEGHTDNTPLTTGKFTGNFELSAVRAANVLDYLAKVHGIDPSRMEVAGYGEYRPLADNSTAEGRARNRRVDIVIVRMQQEPQSESVTK